MCDMSGACSTHWGHVPDGGHAAPTSWEHAEAIPGMWHMPGTAHIPVTCPGRILHMYTCDASGTCGTHPGHVPDGGHTAPTSWEHTEAVQGMCHTPGTVHVPVACPGHILRAQNASYTSGACSTCRGRVLDGGHAAPTSLEHAKAVPGMWHTPGTDSTCSQDVGAACPPSGMCPWHMEHAPDA